MTGELMAAEMAAQPEVLARVKARAPADTRAVRAVLPRPLAGIVFLARGSSDNAAVFGRYLAELRAGRPAWPPRACTPATTPPWTGAGTWWWR